MPDDDASAFDRDRANEDRQHLAIDRTDMAEDRTVLANERTFAGWFRTGLGSVGIGLAFHALFVRMQPPWVPRAIASIFLVMGIYLFLSAERRACAVLDRLSVHRITPVRDYSLKLFAYVSSFAVLALMAAMWLLPM
jgi:putative membrane protein